MKKIIILLLIVSSISFLSFNTTEDCKKYFNGKWKYERYDVEYIYVERNDKKQFEYMGNGKYYYEFDIEWKTDCKYELTYIGTTSPNPAAAEVGEKFTIEIIKINDSVTEYKTVFRNLEDVGKMIRIK
ncbi:serpin family protein [Flaviramulus sp. BrNp1-15]|uniref:serpin family protein n=1 Tax=Flaviramulus sp. BrNp1-15 TaxID=2916754 RepID=UPI001EE7D885|nr:serpin family protein [Flaviramulus sp. BrNp1-15]ULC60180.1 serpin family protein [Flaviramulus sp. BrNp1-15]